MPTADIDGIVTNYEVVGSGPPLLMFSPGGFNAKLENWRSFGVYGRVKHLDHLSQHYRCVIFDRREAGWSGGRVERVTWDHYVTQGRGLLDHLGIGRAHLMGGCMGCSPVAALAVAHPERVASMVLFWPAGGPNYRISSHARFTRHLAYVTEHGLDGVVELAKSHDEPFNRDPRIGPWGSVLRHDEAFAADYARLDPDRYRVLVTGMARTLLDRDTVPGPEPEDLMQLDTPALVVPGDDPAHAQSAARYLQECLANVECWDVPIDEQTSETVPPRLLAFLDGVADQP